ncbi:MAG TPA: NTP transferase domain-containing protein [Ignavibacteriaceae bacterium]|nr:NTP transferase domain-containing protein [Ignavibacteriaceae bacterium]
MEQSEVKQIDTNLKELSSEINYSSGEAAIILAAGHGKRIKSKKSKMLHSIWGVPSVERVHNACTKGLPGTNTIIVVGIKAVDVMKVIGKRENNVFAYQAEQKGTGHAVQIGLDKIDPQKFKGTIYVLPGDMGLMNAETIKTFGEKFKSSGADMMVLTGMYDGPVEHNSYGRIIRVKDFDKEGKPSGLDAGKVIEIIEHKDILALNGGKIYTTVYKGRKYEFTQRELLDNREYNSGVYAFNYQKLIELVYNISSDNAQNEIYITDLISLFNKNNYFVDAYNTKDQHVVMGFNDKSVLKEMEKVFAHKVYDRLRNLIEIDDPDDFFIDESVVEHILELDKQNIPLDIRIGKGVYIGKGVRLNYNIHLKKNVFVDGNVIFGKNVTVWENALLSCFPGQKFVIGNSVEILWGDIIKGNIIIGDKSKIESSVNMTGSDEFPLRIGKGVLIKGTSYIFGSIIEDNVYIEHSVIIKKKVNRLVKRNGEIQRVRFFLPMPSGIDAIDDL